MAKFIGKKFMLHSDAAVSLYEQFARDMPIFDFHNHLPPREICENNNYPHITELWLGGDHYKWRAMRAAGVEERLITGDADPREKFRAFAKVLERLIGNPLYHWAHLELQRYFGIRDPLCALNADLIYDQCAAQISTDAFRPQALLARMKVKALCTTDDPSDSLIWHQTYAKQGNPMKVLPAFRPDRALKIESADFPAYIERLSASENIDIRSMDELKRALCSSLDRFAQAGCLASDHAYQRFVYSERKSKDALALALAGKSVRPSDAIYYKSELMRFLAQEYARRGIVMQLHIGALRNNNTRMFNRLGPDTGYDSIAAAGDPVCLSQFLDSLSREGNLPRTVLYCLNPADNPVLASMAINFADDTAAGKVQFGSAWWFNDTHAGMDAQLSELMHAGLLGGFIGMLTDSRSFTSFPRHEYFRRILCDKLGGMIKRGEYPDEIEIVGAMVRDICLNNAISYFNLGGI